MNTCKTCRYWTPSTDPDDTYGQCGCPKIDGFNRPHDGLEIETCDGPCTSIVTGPDFGCIHHETELETH